MTTTDRFRIASISKVITATVVLQLVDAGFLQLDEPVGQRLAEHRRRRRPATASPRSPCASCCRTRPGSPTTAASSSAIASRRARRRRRSGSARSLAGTPGTTPRLQQPQLLPARPARRRRHRQAVRAGGQRAAVAAARDHRDAPRRHDRPQSRRGRPRVRRPAHVHAVARRRRCLGRHAVGHGAHPRLARPRHAGLASALAGAVGVDAHGARRRLPRTVENGATGSASSCGRTARGGTPAPSRTRTRCSSAAPTG